MDWIPLLLACCAIFVAAIVRGYSGFGFSLLSISALSLIYPPAQIIPSIFLLEIAASLHLLPSIWRQVHWRSLLPLTAGCLVATPFGVWLLAYAPAKPMQIALACFVMAATALLWRGFTLKSMPGTVASTAAGAASGLANGAFGMGGPPVVLFYFSSPAGNAAGRASLIAYFMITDLIGTVSFYQMNMLTMSVAKLAIAFFLPLMAGVALGQKLFGRVQPEFFRKCVLLTLAFLSLLIAAKALLLP